MTKNLEQVYDKPKYDTYRRKTYDDIFILDINTLKFRKCDIKIPKKGECHAITMENKEESKIIISGYIRNACNIMYPSNDVINLIAMYYLVEAIYLLHDEGEFWRISINKILANIK